MTEHQTNNPGSEHAGLNNGQPWPRQSIPDLRRSP